MPEGKHRADVDVDAKTETRRFNIFKKATHTSHRAAPPDNEEAPAPDWD